MTALDRLIERTVNYEDAPEVRELIAAARNERANLVGALERLLRGDLDAISNARTVIREARGIAEP